MESHKEDLIKKIKTLIETIWERKITRESLDRWLNNFSGKCLDKKDEQLSALYLLSQFMYFGNKEMRELLKALYRDLYKYPIIAELRKNSNNTKDLIYLNAKFDEELSKTKFLGVGNPSESGTHLLYYFRQENSLPKTLFIHTHHIFIRSQDRSINLRFPNITRYVFIDDLCGSGSQAIEYSKDIVEDIKASNNSIDTAYYVLFATKEGIENVRKKTCFDSVEAIFELDDTYECFNDNSRYFVNPPDKINNDNAKQICKYYGNNLWHDCPLGYKECQLLLGFYHNIPDNTLPIIWSEMAENGESWTPIFRRYPKIYS